MRHFVELLHHVWPPPLPRDFRLLLTIGAQQLFEQRIQLPRPRDEMLGRRPTSAR